MNSHRKTQPRIHAGRVMFDEGIDVLFQFRECNDLVKQTRPDGPTEPEQATVQLNIVPAGEVRVETGAKLEHRCDWFDASDLPTGRRSDPRGQFQHSALAAAIPSDQPQNLALLTFEVDIPQSP